MIVALYSYESGSGKDTAADYIAEWCDEQSLTCTRAAFADVMKIVAADALGIEGDDATKIAIIDEIKLTGYIKWARLRHDHKVMQESRQVKGRDFIIGLAGDSSGDYGVRRWDQEFWIRHAATSNADVHVITDLRFTPEAEYVRQANGLLIEVRRRDGNLGHRNEDVVSCDAVINNDSDLSDLRALTRASMFGLGVHERANV